MARKYKPISKRKVAPNRHRNLVQVDRSIRRLVAHYKKLLIIRDIIRDCFRCARVTLDWAIQDSNSSGAKLENCYQHWKLYQKHWLEIKPLTILTSKKVEVCNKYFYKRTTQEDSVLRRETDILLASNSRHCLKLSEVFDKWPWLPLTESRDATLDVILKYFVDLSDTA